MKPKQDQNALDEVRRVYADLAARPIDRNCVRLKECCHFKLTGRTPYLTKGEALVAARALRTTGRARLPENPTGTCPMLEASSGNCLIYEARLSDAALISARRPAALIRGGKSLI